MVNVLLVDDHDLVRTGIRVLLEHTGSFNVIADVGSAVDALAVCKKTLPDIVVMDLSIPGLDGIEATSEIGRLYPKVRVVVLTAHHDEAVVVSAIRAGAAGFVLKKAKMEELVDALKVVAAGGVFLSSEVSHLLYESIQRDGGAARTAAPIERLTNRETQVMRLVAQGMTNKEVAETMGLSPETVRSYRKALMKKLGVHNVAGMTQMAMKAGIGERFTDAQPAKKSKRRPPD